MTDLFANVLYMDHYGQQSVVNGLLEESESKESYSHVSLRKGQKVTLRSGKTVVVEGCSENYFWCGREALPYWKGEVVG